MKYEVVYGVREPGAIGVTFAVRLVVEATGLQDAADQFRKHFEGKYDFVTPVRITEVSPTDGAPPDDHVEFARALVEGEKPKS